MEGMSRSFIVVKCKCGAHIGFIHKRFWERWLDVDFTVDPCPWCIKSEISQRG